MNAEPLEKWLDEHEYQPDHFLGTVVRLQDLRALFAGKVLVPVELLHAIEIDMTMECTNFDTLNQLRSIIDKENT